MAKKPFMPLVFSKLSKRTGKRWFHAPIRGKCGDTRYFVLPGQCWVEVWRQVYPNRFASLCLVVGAGELQLDSQDALWRLHMSFFDKIPTGGASAGGGRLPDDPGFSKRYPTIWAFLTMTEYEPGKPRERSGLTLHVDDGCFKLFLSEKSKEAGIDATGATLQACLEALEARLTSEAPGWRSTARKGRGKR
jgi:hypothetical protein